MRLDMVAVEAEMRSLRFEISILSLQDISE